MHIFTLITNEIKDEGMARAKEIASEILKVSDDIKVYIAEMQQCRDFDFKDTECIIVLGGDGTLLRVAQDTSDKDIPIIGINTGNLGYLAEVEYSNVSNAIQKLFVGQYHIEERMMLDGQIVNSEYEGNPSEKISALNDVVLSRKSELQIVGYRVYVNGLHLKDFYADGIIIGTPTGSTGYNMSAGGPIVEPNAKLILLTPVCPHTLNTRSIILSADDIVEIEILPSKGDKPVLVGAYFDGRNDINLVHGDKIKVMKSDTVTKICKISHVGFLELLQKKMSER